MKLYFQALMQINGLVGCVGVIGGFYYQTPILVGLGMINFMCAYLCYLNLELIAKKG